jgi:hypothetical protein
MMMENGKYYHLRRSGEEIDSLLDKIENDNVGDVDSSLSDISEKPLMNKVVTKELGNKVDKVEGKGLSTEDFTTQEKEKLASLENYDDSDIREEINSINPAPMVRITYDELVELRDRGELVSGMQYRIIDYETTTAQENTQSAGHQFDVIVTADNANTLNEVARACLHEEDTYFSEAGAKLEAWQLWYSLDNNAKRFAWADADNGKGVIYRMIDDRNNDLPYDFKNIKFLRYELYAPEEYVAKGNDDKWIAQLSENVRAKFEEGQLSYIWAGIGHYSKYWEEVRGTLFSSTTGNYSAFYTFSTDSDEDASLLDSCRDNKMLPHGELPNNVFFGNKCYSNSFGNGCHSNSFGNECNYNSFGSECYSNSFGNECGSNSFGNAYTYNSFGNNCYSNSFGNGCYSNSFGNECNYNSFGSDCGSNGFGNECGSNSFGNGCHYNSFGSDCGTNGFGNGCYSNSFGNECNYNSFGNECYSNSFGNGCYSNSFGNDCGSNSFRDLDGFASFSYCNFDTGVCSLEIYCDDYNGAYNVKYIHVYSGVSGWVEIGSDREYETCYACDKKGNVHEFCIMDFSNS